MKDEPALTYSFEKELMAAFGEVEREAMPQRFTVTNREASGVIRKTVDETPGNEVGYEPREIIVIVVTRDQFGTQPVEAPQGTQREIVQVLEGPCAGKWVLIDVKADLAHYHLTCTQSQ